MFGFNLDAMPRIDLNPVYTPKAKALLSNYPNPIAFCPTCSKAWNHIRQRPHSYWKPVIAKLRQRHTILQFGFHDYPLLEGAVRMPFIDLELLAAVYHQIGNYVGVNTGDHHLMLAVGGRTVIAEPDPMPPFEAEIWSYDKSNRIEQGKLSHPHTMIAAIEKMGL